MKHPLRDLIWILFLFPALSMAAAAPAAEEGAEPPRMFVHLKTSLGHDDAQICVAYNMIWAALRQGMAVDVLVDADGINTFKRGIFSEHDAIETYRIPDSLRRSIARQFAIELADVPETYGGYLQRLARDGAHFYINKAFLIVAGIADSPDKDLGRIAPYAAKIFKPVDLQAMLRLRQQADFDFTY